MKTLRKLSLAVALMVFVAAPLTGRAADEKKAAKPYPLDTCAVSDEKLGEMGKPYVFEYKGQEIKLCCKSCKKDFDKNPEKFVKKMEQKAAKASKANSANAHGHDHSQGDNHGHNH